MATYVFVANQLHLHPGLNDVTLAGTLNNGMTKFQTSNVVLNVPYASQVKGNFAKYLGRGGVYERLSQIEAKHPGVVIPSSNATAVTRSANPAPGRTAGLKVTYAPVVHATRGGGERSRAVPKAARPVVAIPKARAGAADFVSKVPTLLRHSMNDFLHHVG
jgi:hypothetical protein